MPPPPTGWKVKLLSNSVNSYLQYFDFSYSYIKLRHYRLIFAIMILKRANLTPDQFAFNEDIS